MGVLADTAATAAVIWRFRTQWSTAGRRQALQRHTMLMYSVV